MSAFGKVVPTEWEHMQSRDSQRMMGEALAPGSPQLALSACVADTNLPAAVACFAGIHTLLRFQFDPKWVHLLPIQMVIVPVGLQVQAVASIAGTSWSATGTNLFPAETG